MAAFQVKWGLDKIKAAIFCKADILVYEYVGWRKSKGKTLPLYFCLQFHLW